MPTNFYKLLKKLPSVITITLLALLLASCGGPRRYQIKNDAPPPKRNINFSRIPNPVPRYEPKSRYGNKSPYKVLGNWYHVLPNARGYNQRGLISWYGTKFHGHLTSNREIYNLYSMTAASKILPLPTYVLVTNLRNGRRVILRVNDRGPFVSTRIMDISYAAAQKLGFIKTGTTYAQVTAIDPAAWEQYQRNSLKYANYQKPSATAPQQLASNYQSRTTYHTENVPMPPHPSPEVITEATALAANAAAATATTATSVTTATATTNATADTSNTATTTQLATAQPPSQDIYLQVGAFTSIENANQLSNKITALTNVPANINQSTNKQQPIYRVEIGPIADNQEQAHVEKIIATQGLEHPFIVDRKQ